MLYQSLEDLPDLDHFDVAIFGSGPAGISLALELAKSGHTVGLFEAGGANPTPISEDDPYYAENVGRQYDPVNTRLRFFGGTSNHWGGWCRPLDHLDFLEKPYAKFSGWPIRRKDLEPYYETAIRYCEVNTNGLGLAAFEESFDFEDFNYRDNDVLTVRNFLFSPPTRFGRRYQDAIEQQENLHCVLNTPLAQLHKGTSGLDYADVFTRGLRFHKVVAKRYVLAMGAIENARYLLHSDVGNEGDFVGRCFSDHLGSFVASVIQAKSNRYFLHEVDATKVLPHLSFTDEYCLENSLLNFGAMLDPYNSSKPIYGEMNKQVRWLTGQDTRRFVMVIRMENTPNPESRISLSQKKDRMGMPQVKVDWRPAEIDFESLERTTRLMTRELGVANARMQVDYREIESRRGRYAYQAHHMGTTRMSSGPAEGVVDANLRVHQVDNLYVTGSSVFPSFGFANPTLTVVALSARLAEHLAKIG